MPVTEPTVSFKIPGNTVAVWPQSRRTLATVVAIALFGLPLAASGQARFEILHRFSTQSEPERPSALVEAADGNLYGTTEWGGDFGAGTVFRVTRDGRLITLHSFAGGTEGRHPSGLTEGSDGNLYGTTFGFPGTAFRVSLDGTLTTLNLENFSGRISGTRFVAASDGNLYLPTQGPTVLKVVPPGTITVFATANVNSLVQAADGNFYGTSSAAWGSITRLGPDGTATLLHTFTGGGDGGRPIGPLVAASDGNLYGFTSDAPIGLAAGTFFRITPAGQLTTLFSSAWEVDPSPLIRAADGGLYGIQGETIFRVTLDGTIQPINTSACGGGSPSDNTLMQASDGTFFGTCADGGVYGFGFVFSATAAGTVTPLASFTPGPDGSYPDQLVRADDGTLYGTTAGGGNFNFGTVFKRSPDGAVQILHAFTGPDGRYPSALALDTDGSLHGTTRAGGTYDKGTAFRLSPSGSFALLHHFGGGATEGGSPSALVRGSDGNFYGLGRQSPTGWGTVFRLAPSGVVTTLRHVSFSDGGAPRAIVNGADGQLYGLLDRSIFRMSYDGSFAVLHAFTTIEGWSEGRGRTALIQARDGSFYGTLPCGRPYRSGVFRMAPDGTVVFLNRFHTEHCSDYGYSPSLGIVEAADGSFFVSVNNDTSRESEPQGWIYKMTAGGTLTLLHTVLQREGWYPSTSMAVAPDGKLYGTTLGFSSTVGGTVFVLDPLVPFQPTLALATPIGFAGIALSWTAAPGATSYMIRRIGPGGTVTIIASGLTGTTFVDPFHLLRSAYSYIVSGVNAFGESLPSSVVSLWNTIGTRTPTVATVRDYDGDRKADLTVYRSSTGEWFTWRSTDRGTSVVPWGAPGYEDRPVPADYDGDGAADVAVFRETSGEWFVRLSSNSMLWRAQWGAPELGDLPVPADYDGDGRADLAIYRITTGQWIVHRSQTGTQLSPIWGAPELGDLPVPADYDGDGVADLAVYRTTAGRWFIHLSTTGMLRVGAWGSPSLGDIPVPADYDGDRKTDFAVYRTTTGQWFIAYSSGAPAGIGSWGSPLLGDVPMPADYNGDGRAEPAVYRSTTGEWFLTRTPFAWGAPAMGDAVHEY